MDKRYKSNCLNFVRGVAAIQIFLGHAIGHLNLPDGVLKIADILQGVPIFFLLSGFLIWASIERTHDFKTYVKKRILRLYPELWGGGIAKCV